MLFSTFSLILVSPVFCSLVSNEGRDISNLEFSISRDSNNYPTITGFFPDSDQQPRTMRIRTLGSLSDLDEDSDLRFLFYLTTADPSIDPLPVTLANPNDRYMDMSFGSDFSQTVGDMMLLPTNPGQSGTLFRMITSTTDPTRYCADAAMILLPLRRVESRRPVFNVEVGLLTPDTNDYMSLSSAFGGYGNEGPYTERFPVELSTELKTMKFPFSIQRAILDAIGSEGFMVDQRYSRLESGCAEIIPRLPRIQISLIPSGEHMGNVFFEPEDYIRIDEATGECEILIDLSHREPRDFAFGIPFFEQIGVFFDYDHGQIGLCEPL